MLMILSTEARRQDAITVHLPPEEPEIRMVMDLVRKDFPLTIQDHILRHIVIR